MSKLKSQPMQVKRLAVVLPRYGASLGGGAETLVRELALHALASGLAGEVEVWTTCAMDHRTWANFLPPGETRDGEVLVRRFPVDERDLEVFIRSEMKIHQRVPLTADEQFAWLGASVNSAALYDHIARYGRDFDAILFAPYLFATSFWGALIYPERSLIVPCLHDEPYAYQSVFQACFERVAGVLFNAPPEGDLAKRIYRLDSLDEKGTVVGMGFEPFEEQDVTAVRPRTNPYLLYSGRKEQGKNLDLLFAHFGEYRARHPESELELVVIGSGDINFCEKLPQGIIDLGFVSEADKHALMKNAVALCQPSVNESFSIVMMEAWQMGTPSIVHARCPVTVHHVVASGGGLYFDSADEFCKVADLLYCDSELRNTLGQGGRDYVATVYCWDAVLDRFAEGLQRAGLACSPAELPVEARVDVPCLEAARAGR